MRFFSNKKIIEKQWKKYAGHTLRDSGQMIAEFSGTPHAELFGRLVNESLAGTFIENIVRNSKKDGEEGRDDTAFVHTSIMGQPWHGTLWSRDAGTYLRELIYWGADEEMRLLANLLIDLVDLNEEGFYTYPEFFRPGSRSHGNEVDGTCAIVIALSLLAQLLASFQSVNNGDPLLTKIRNFLLCDQSPLHFFSKTIDSEGLVAGTGEFGPGCGLGGKMINVVQNGLVRLALISGARVAKAANDNATAEYWRKIAIKLEKNMQDHLMAEDGSWLWCITPKTLKPDPAILQHKLNDGFGGILGVFCMQSDVLGLIPDETWLGLQPSLTTFNKLWNFPTRKRKFQKYGIWIQFNRYLRGTHSGPSYGHGYALQSMLLLNFLRMAQKGLNGLVEFTYDRGQKLSPYYIFEQWRVPPVRRMPQIGCGELNLVNVAEILKTARMIIGLDDSDPSNIRLVPRLPPQWSGALVKRMPMRTLDGIIRVKIRIKRENGNLNVGVFNEKEEPVPISVINIVSADN